MATKEPFQYELNPRAVVKGRTWLTVTLENDGSKILRGLHVRLNSLDDYGVEVLTEDAFVPLLDPGARYVIPMRVSARLSGSVYVTVEGERDGEPFHWESPDIQVTVGDEAAQLVRLLALVEPIASPGDLIRCEATVRGRLQSEGLKLEFWADAPDGEFKELAIVETKALAPGEEAHYVAEVEADQDGRYAVYAYLYDGAKRIDREVETIQVAAA